jgi:hypothetical protein
MHDAGIHVYDDIRVMYLNVQAHVLHDACCYACLYILVLLLRVFCGSDLLVILK